MIKIDLVMKAKQWICIVCNLSVGGLLISGFFLKLWCFITGVHVLLRKPFKKFSDMIVDYTCFP